MTLIETDGLEYMTDSKNEEYEYTYQRMKKEKMYMRLEAIFKVADGEHPKCAVCGCPHVEILQFGHFNGDGHYHRKQLHRNGNLIPWIRRTPIEEVKKKIQLECPYCNSWHALYGEYPPPNKRPQWIENNDPYPHQEQTILDIFQEVTNKW